MNIPDGIEDWLRKEFNYTEEQIEDFKRYAEKHKDGIANFMKARSGFYYIYTSHMVDRARRKL